MARALWAGWALPVFLAALLPVAVPYAIWPRREGRQASVTAECARRAGNDAARETPFVLFPRTSEVDFCDRNDAGFLTYTAEVTARGPYGIPVASGSVETRSIHHLQPHGGLKLGLVALLSGLVVVSIPFSAAYLATRLRAAHATA